MKAEPNRALPFFLLYCIGFFEAVKTQVSTTTL